MGHFTFAGMTVLDAMVLIAIALPRVKGRLSELNKYPWQECVQAGIHRTYD